MSAQRIAVVGAGIAGLAAARRLSNAQVVVFEEARRPGGRLSTRRFGALAFDHGAQYFTCRDPAFEALVADWCVRGIAAPWRGRIRLLEAGSGSGPGGDEDRYVGVPGMSALAHDLAAELDVECGRRIACVERSTEGWCLTSADGRELGGFDTVVVATPAPEAARLATAVPALAQRVAAVAMQPCHAVMVAFSRPLDVDFDGAFLSRSPLSWVARNGGKPGRPEGECWVLHTTPEWSADHLEDPADAVSSELLRALAAALGFDLPPAAGEVVRTGVGRMRAVCFTVAVCSQRWPGI